MAQVIFLPQNITVDAAPAPKKLLAVALDAGVPIRYGCGAGRCGLCAVRILAATGALSPLSAKENELLAAFGLPGDGSIRLACQAKVIEGTVTVDLAFQDAFEP